jgi:hypothetical protein
MIINQIILILSTFFFFKTYQTFKVYECLSNQTELVKQSLLVLSKPLKSPNISPDISKIIKNLIRNSLMLFSWLALIVIFLFCIYFVNPLSIEFMLSPLGFMELILLFWIFYYFSKK